MLSSTGASMLLAVVFTLPATVIDISYRSKKKGQARTPWQLRACLTRKFPAYLFILLVMNALIALALATYVPVLYMEFDQRLGFWAPFVYAVFAVFAFEVVLANLSVFLFDKSLPIFQSWVEQARDLAVGAAIEKQARIDGHVQDQMARGLLDELPTHEFNAYLLKHLGRVKMDELEEEAKAKGADSRLYQAMELADKMPNTAKGILDEARKRAP